MNKNNLKSYAPQARKDFIAAVKARANMLGLSDDGGSLKIEPANVSGDVAIIAGREWPAKVEKQRQALIKKMQAVSFAQTIEAVAYTWFNRFVALRYMELHDYLDHGFRVLSNPNGPLPEILGKLTELHLDGLDIEYAKQLRLAGNKDGELYRLLLIAQCNALSKAMPFMFEQIDDETELLLPDNLLLTDSIIAKLVKEIPEEDWAQVEIIGWLYQFYISEKKDEVIGKVVKSEDIPAATQLFTPNWIVQYLVQNSVGRLWMMANPSSSIHTQWPYYIKPAEQTPEVNAQLEQLINTRIAEDGTTLNPESITVLDPACGSGHILVEAYETLKQIYLERGYQPRAIPRLILERNLYGIDIDDRAAQLAGFALLMKARADDRRILQEPPKLNVISLQESKGLNADNLAQSLSKFGVNRNAIADLIDTFQHAKTYGSLIQIPAKLTTALKALYDQCQHAQTSGDLFAQEAAQSLMPIINQAILLARKYDSMIANPPYMGGKYLVKELKVFVNSTFPNAKGDLFSCFIERGYTFTIDAGYISMITMQSWMFLSSFDQFREQLVLTKTIENLTQLGNGVMIGFGTVAFILRNIPIINNLGTYSFISNDDLNVERIPSKFPVINNKFSIVNQDKFKKIPGVPVGYWVGESTISAFEAGLPIGEKLVFKQGMATSNNERFLRCWYEVSQAKVDLLCRTPEDLCRSEKKWFPYSKGGAYRKWYGNNELLVNWSNNGEELKRFTSELPQGMNVRLKSREYYCIPSLTYSTLALTFGCRMNDSGFIFDVKGSCIFGSDFDRTVFCGFLNSSVARHFLEILCPTLDFQMIGVRQIPVLSEKLPNCVEDVVTARQISMDDWNSFERSWNFKFSPLLPKDFELPRRLESSYNNWININSELTALLKRVETDLNRLFINAYELENEINPEIPIDEITLTCNPAYRYGKNVSIEDQLLRLQKDTAQELISYIIGCMMGRYSLDAPGLIYAHAGNEGFAASKYTTFPADADGIIPITDMLWFEDDAANRVQEFLQVVWGKATLDENMSWLAESLGGKESETPIETIRRYLSNSFYKDHLQTYKKRPIYWHFSSGKQGAFQAFVYLHRYNEGTLARMRSEYVVPLMGKLKARIEMLDNDANSATSTAARNKLNKEIEQLNKKQFELQTYDEKLRHYADMRIKLDLDDGVKVNYGKFGDLLSDVKAITGGSDD